MKAKLRRLRSALGITQEESGPEQLLSEDVDDDALPTSLGSMLMPVQDNDWEELIRTGLMTPFGTKITPKEEHKPRKLMLNETSDFEKYLADQAQMAAQRNCSFATKKGRKERVKKEAKEDGKAFKSVNQSVTMPSAEKRLTKRMHKLQSKALHTLSRTGIPCKRDVPSTESSQKHDSEGSVYSPDEQEQSMEDEEDESMHDCPSSDYELKPLQRKKVAKRHRNQGMDPDFLPISDEDDEETHRLLKGKRCRDDGDPKVFKHRIRNKCKSYRINFTDNMKYNKSRKSSDRISGENEGFGGIGVRQYQKQQAKETQQRSAAEASEDSDVEFDEGFCVPGSIWKKLYSLSPIVEV
ncbi:unnamed protein product [Ranitomeya imitator]|uniref:Uncharacterized protein n=1 Tax=Ranitomeya imitator TaxID=111125 RepID=A0ABN9KXU1_9NEOB|nr:unnamed protein product [Ranitomeya imitator]